MNTKRSESVTSAMSERPRWSARARAFVSVLILLHLAAVFTAPFIFASSGPEAVSPVARSMMDLFGPYIDAAYLNHGYFFFAPNPGPSHLLHCRMEFEDGRAPVERWFPDRSVDFPRLLYHRHFMLAEQLHALYVPDQPPPDLNSPEALSQWRRQRAMYDARRKAFEEHLRIKYGAQRVTITRVEHGTLSPEQRLRGMALTDPSLYRELSETQLPDAPWNAEEVFP